MSPSRNPSESHTEFHTQAQGWRLRGVQHPGGTHQSCFAPFSRIPTSSRGLSLRKHLPLPAATVSNIKEEQLPAGIPSCATRPVISRVSKQHKLLSPIPLFPFPLSASSCCLFPIPTTQCQGTTVTGGLFWKLKKPQLPLKTC